MKNLCNMCGTEERLDKEYCCRECAQAYIVPYLERNRALGVMDERICRLLDRIRAAT